MGNNKNSSEEKTPYFCAKHKRYISGDCIKCVDPELYCKFRSACIVRFLEKEQKSSKE